MAKNRKVLLKGNPCITEEYACSGAISPGQLLDLNSSSQWVPAVANSLSRTIALERDEMGRGIDDDYASGEVVKAASLYGGCRFNGRLQHATGTATDVDIGSIVVGAASGAVVPFAQIDPSSDGAPTDAELQAAFGEQKFRVHSEVDQASSVNTATFIVDLEVI